MNARAAYLMASLGLAPHPEGGYYRQIYRSRSEVQPLDSRPVRPALTSIYFLLSAGDISRWHLVASDEVWHFYEGAPLELLTADRAFTRVGRHRLGPTDGDSEQVHAVPAGEWQAARSTGHYTLVGCTVGPGFEFADFKMLRDIPAEVEPMRQRHPEMAAFI